MPLLINLRHLAHQNVQFQGELTLAELDLDLRDDMVQVTGPVAHDLEAQLVGDDLLVRGSLRMKLACECVRCLKPFASELNLADWTCLLPLKGEEKVAIQSDCVDLTPLIREDIILAFPQHPVCDAKCSGLAKTGTGQEQSGGQEAAESDASAWAALDKLKL